MAHKNPEQPLKILAFINDSIKKNSISPSVREISACIELALSVIHYHIDQMEEDGWITCDKSAKGNRKSRSIIPTRKGLQQLEAVRSKEAGSISGRFLKPGYAVLSARISNRKALHDITIPVVAVISASFGTETYSSDFSLGLDSESYLNISQDMIPGHYKAGELYALEVKGDSMIDAGIQSGDFVILHKTSVAQNGDMCAVWIDEREGTLKYFYHEDRHIRLQPANPRMPPLPIGPSQTISIQGKVILVVRRQTEGPK